MKKFFLFLVIVVPIVSCVIALNNIWSDDDEPTFYEDNDKQNNASNTDPNDSTTNPTEPPKEETYQMGDEEFKSTIGGPISKIVENATINISVANVYLNPDENSEVLDTVTKHTVVTTQAFPNGWSRIKSASSASGWVRTDNITLPDNSGDVSVGTALGRTGVVNVTSLNVRASASTTASIKDRLTEGTEVKILEVSGDSSWYKVQWQTLEGWVSSQYITLK